MTLSIDKIVHGVRGSELVAPLMPSETLVESCVAKVRSERCALRRTDEGAARLLRL